MATYYIDLINGKSDNNGLSENSPLNNYMQLDLKPGDKVLFKRGTFYRGMLNTTSGDDENPITYGAYGEGENPIFCGSTNASNKDDWEEVSKNVWKCKLSLNGDVGNIVFNGDECSATLRWTKEELTSQGDFFDRRYGIGEGRPEAEKIPEFLLYSEKNPAEYYDSIEICAHEKRRLSEIKSNTVYENLSFINSGVHGIQGNGKNVTIRNCKFEHIGGCVWSNTLRIRFGNCLEFWAYGENVLIDNCFFKDVYDSCVTHQGPGDVTIPAKKFDCINSVFDTYGMAAFEYRDKLPIDSVFTGNVCKNAGCGFAMSGEVLPRKSEIWPQPMGHHIFMWRIEKGTEGGHLEICNNKFEAAPNGAAIYSIISKEAEKQTIIDNNKYNQKSYSSNPNLLNRYGGKDYTDFDLYRIETGNDIHSVIER